MPSPASVLTTSTVRGVELREIVYREHVIPRHSHDTAGFCLVVDGDYEERYARRTLTCRARSVTFSPAGEMHANVFGSRAHCLTIELPVTWIDRLESGRLQDPFETHGGAMTWIGERLLREMRAPEPLVLEGLVLEMIGEASRTSSRENAPSPAMRRAYDLVHAHFREPLSLSDLGAALGRHPVYVASAFRRAYGETIGDCIRRLRVEHAARALAQSDASIAEIALAAGFANQSHFTRAFKRATGTTPAAFLKPRPRAFHPDKTPRFATR